MRKNIHFFYILFLLIGNFEFKWLLILLSLFFHPLFTPLNYSYFLHLIFSIICSSSSHWNLCDGCEKLIFVFGVEVVISELVIVISFFFRFRVWLGKLPSILSSMIFLSFSLFFLCPIGPSLSKRLLPNFSPSLKFEGFLGVSPASCDFFYCFELECCSQDSFA